MPNQMFRIAWRSSNTGFSGHGAYCLSEEVAQAYIERLNTEYPEFQHWLQPSPPPPLNLSGHFCCYGDDTFVPATPSPQPKE